MAQVIAEEAGVRLTFNDAAPLRTSGKGGAHYRLTTMRINPPRVFANRDDALAAYEREVRASLEDPVVIALTKRMGR